MEPDKLKRLVRELAEKYPDPDELVARLCEAAPAEGGLGGFLHVAAMELKLVGLSKTALTVCRRALAACREEGNTASAADCLVVLGVLLQDTGNVRGSVEPIREAIAYAAGAGDDARLSGYLMRLGLAFGVMGSIDKATTCYRRSLALAEKLGDLVRQPQIHHNLAQTLLFAGRMNESMQHFEAALRLSRTTNLPNQEAFALAGIGAVHGYLGDLRRALQFTEDAAGIWREHGNKPRWAECRQTLAWIQAELGDYEQAERSCLESIALMRETGDRTGEGFALTVLADVRLHRGDVSGAVTLMQESLAIGRACGHLRLAATSAQGLGVLSLKSGDFSRAEQYLGEALEAFRRLGNIYRQARCLGDLGRVSMAKTGAAAALPHWSEAASMVETLRGRDVPVSSRQSYWKENVSLYDELTGGHWRAGGFGQALEASERGKGRTVHDLLMARGIDSGRFNPAPMSLDEIRGLARRIDRYLALFRVTDEGTYAFVVTPGGQLETVSAPGFTARRLAGLAVEFEGGQPVGGWFGSYARRAEDRERAGAMLAEGRFSAAVEVLEQSERDWFAAIDRTLAAIGDELMSPVFERIPAGSRVTLVPNRALNVLPLHACSRTVGGRKRYLLDDYEFAYAPNCNILDLCAKRDPDHGARPPADSLFAVANAAPPYELVFSEWEVAEIAGLFREKEVLVRSDARQALLERAGNAAILHVSAHGLHDLGSSFNSRLRLGEDLTLDEIFRHLRLDRSWLVSLSACESGLLDYRDIADEFIGLQAGFLYAGAPTVIASLWSVADHTSALLMARTYDGIFRHRLAKAAALRRAQRWLRDATAGELVELLRTREAASDENAAALAAVRRTLQVEDPSSRPYAHPYYWAGFQLFGV